MAYRFTNTDKWNDSWFANLKPIEKLLFIYLCDNCDIAGFIEINIRRWAADIDSDKGTIEGALKGLGRGLIASETNDCIYIKNFLKHQKNYPINPNNQAHKGIIARFINYSHKFNFTDYNEFIEGAKKGLESPIGNGIGNGIGIKEKGGVGEKEKKTKYADYVTMRDSDHQKLVENYGDEATRQMIEILDNYKGSSGKTYKDDYRAILSWVVKKREEETQKQNGTHKQLTTRSRQVREQATEALQDLLDRL